MIESFISDNASINLYLTLFQPLRTNVRMAKCTAKMIINVEQMANVFSSKLVTDSSEHFCKFLLLLTLKREFFWKTSKSYRTQKTEQKLKMDEKISIEKSFVIWLYVLEFVGYQTILIIDQKNIILKKVISLTFDLLFRLCRAGFCVNYCRCEGSNLGIGMPASPEFYKLLLDLANFRKSYEW